MLKPFDWDFRSVPDDQIEEYWIYEFSRERSDLIELVEVWRRELSKPGSFRSFMRMAGGRKTGIIALKGRVRFIPVGGYFMFPEWPRKPFQEIPFDERKERFGVLSKNDASMARPQTKRAEAIQRDPKDLGRSVPSLRKIEPHPSELGMIRQGDWISMPSFVFDTANLSEESTDQIAFFRIAWDLSDKELLKLFSEWLKANRRRRPLTQGSVGGSDPLRKKKKELEWLGKVRIVRSLDDDYLRKWQGKRLFADQAQWTKCRKAVEDIVSRLSVNR